MNEALLRNPDVLDSSNITTTGRQVFGIRKGDGQKITDFGLIESLEFSRDPQIRELKSNRKGRTKTYKKVIDEDNLTATFQTSSTGNAAVREWFLGSKPKVTAMASAAFAGTKVYALNEVVLAGGRLYKVTTAGTSAAAAPVWPTATGATVASDTVTFTDIGTVADNEIRAFSGDASINRGGVIIVLSTEESDSGRSIIRVYPNADVQGTGEPDIQDFNGYEFEMTTTSNTGFVPPALLGDFATAKPDGVVYDVPNSRLAEAWNLLATALIQHVDPL